LAPTGTPVDRSLHVSLPAIEAIHVGWENGVRLRGAEGYNTKTHSQLQPVSITAALFGMTSRLKTFSFQRQVNDYDEEPVMAIIPGATLQQLWSMLRVVERALLAISGLVVLSGLLGLLTVILAGLNERRREMALLRALGAPAKHVFSLLCGEAALIALAGVLLGVCLHYGLLLALAPFLLERFGVLVNIGLLAPYIITWLALFVLIAALLGALPAIRVYRQTLSDGLSQRI
ncbi:MAG: FtsX-like permease family protein, partial [Granulosicoccaceae bacterium]